MAVPALTPNAWFAVTIAGVWLVAAEFCFPGRVVFSAVGAVFMLGGVWELCHASHGPNWWLAISMVSVTAIGLSMLLRVAAAGRRKKSDP
jgi:membrane protein implicated in regulation of membrane protease activity